MQSGGFQADNFIPALSEFASQEPEREACREALITPSF